MFREAGSERRNQLMKPIRPTGWASTDAPPFALSSHGRQIKRYLLWQERAPDQADVAVLRDHVRQLRAAVRAIDRVRAYAWISIETEPLLENLPVWHRLNVAAIAALGILDSFLRESMKFLQEASERVPRLKRLPG